MGTDRRQCRASADKRWEKTPKPSAATDAPANSEIDKSRTYTNRLRPGPEAMLVAQAATLNTMFTQRAFQTAHMTIVDQIDRFTRLALKAHSQCRATLETRAVIKNPPVSRGRPTSPTGRSGGDIWALKLEAHEPRAES